MGMYQVTPAGDRLAKWDEKLKGDLLSVRVALLKPMMKIKITEAFNKAVELETGIKTVLDPLSEGTLMQIWYIAAGKEMYKAKLKFGGDCLIAKIDIIMSKWVAQGLTPATLVQIRDYVLTVAGP